MIKGIDISHWNPITDSSNLFDKIDNTKISFVIMKLSQYKSKDKKFEQYYSALKDKYKTGCYIYNKVYSIEQARIEAQYAVQELKGRDMEAWVWLDMEDSSMIKLGKTKLTEIIDTEAEILRAAGYKVGIYSNPNWYNNVLDGKNLSKRYKFWIARYPRTDDGTLKESLSPKSYASIWQYSSKGKVNGISGNVDMDILYEDIFSVNTTTSASSQTTSQTPQSPITSTVSEYIKIGQFHANNFTGVEIPLTGKFDNDTKKQAARVLQHAMNLDYKVGLDVDGIFGTKSVSKLGNHYTRKGETQYMVSALIILLLLHDYPVPLNANPATFDATLEAVVKQYQTKVGLPATGIASANTYKLLLTEK